uniref:Uncharacterized protein n=1 Tax=Pseudobryopsis hainanensis TaxID=2320808 RepID=A0A3S5X149_9CHLO|nr:hypothetical protein [Pseudobryopsis hainanensis]
MVNVGPFEYVKGLRSYWNYSNWSHRVLSVGYNYKHFQLEHTLYSEFSEPKLQLFMGLDVPGCYFKEMLSSRYVESTPNSQCFEPKKVTGSTPTVVIETVEIEPLTSTTTVEEPEATSHLISMVEDELLEEQALNETENLSVEVGAQTVQETPSTENIQRKQGLSDNQFTLEPKPILIGEQALKAARIAQDLEINPMNAEVEEEGSVAEMMCGQKTYSEQIESQGLAQSEAVPPASLASTAHSSGPIGMGQALAAGVLFLGCTSLVVGHIWHRLNKVFNA